MLFLSRRYQILKKVIIDGYAQVPHLYFTFGVMGVACVGLVYRQSVLQGNVDALSFRHKDQYVVVRPDDPRLSNYPRKYITDVDVIEEYEKRQQKQQQ